MVPPGGYLWWYADGLSICGRYGLSAIAFVGSVFSPYYAWSGRKDPGNHMAINIALYAPGSSHWAMTERGREATVRSETQLQVGPSALKWDGDVLTISFDEIAVPRPPAQWLPHRVRGTIRVTPKFISNKVYDIDRSGAHRWWPVAPRADIHVDLDGDVSRSWNGHGYMDSNWGTEPLERRFRRWDWARGQTNDGETVILYDTEAMNGERQCLALSFDNWSRCASFEPGGRNEIKPGFWGVKRFAHADAGSQPRLMRTLEDSPFYTRSLVETRLSEKRVTLMHESFSGERFASPTVKAMLPFRMPRRAHSALRSNPFG